MNEGKEKFKRQCPKSFVEKLLKKTVKTKNEANFVKQNLLKNTNKSSYRQRIKTVWAKNIVSKLQTGWKENKKGK